MPTLKITAAEAAALAGAIRTESDRLVAVRADSYGSGLAADSRAARAAYGRRARAADRLLTVYAGLADSLAPLLGSEAGPAFAEKYAPARTPRPAPTPAAYRAGRVVAAAARASAYPADPVAARVAARRVAAGETDS